MRLFRLTCLMLLPWILAACSTGFRAFSEGTGFSVVTPVGSVTVDVSPTTNPIAAGWEWLVDAVTGGEPVNTGGSDG